MFGVCFSLTMHIMTTCVSVGAGPSPCKSLWHGTHSDQRSTPHFASFRLVNGRGTDRGSPSHHFFLHDQSRCQIGRHSLGTQRSIWKRTVPVVTNEKH